MFSRFALKGKTIVNPTSLKTLRLLSTQKLDSNKKSLEISKAKETLHKDLECIHADIRTLFDTQYNELRTISSYYFDGSGKSIRPQLICLMARIVNSQCASRTSTLSAHQRQIGLIAEMIHVASLIHDDIVDSSELRRGKESVNARWGSPKAVFAGDFILATASRELARIGNAEVIECLSKVLEDLVMGELMQFGAKEADHERFEHYLTKTYRKTASLIANSCKAVAILSENSTMKLVDASFECGKNVGMAFQLVDDMLDFTSKSETMGKPGAGADLKLGLATAPVLFAASEFPQLNAMIMRRFSEKDDCARAFDFVMRSSGLAETRHLALKYCDNAFSSIKRLENQESCEIEYLKHMINYIVNRDK